MNGGSEQIWNSSISQESGKVCLLCINLAFIYDVMASFLVLRKLL
jgi:hypothetical protein